MRYRSNCGTATMDIPADYREAISFLIAKHLDERYPGSAKSSARYGAQWYSSEIKPTASKPLLRTKKPAPDDRQYEPYVVRKVAGMSLGGANEIGAGHWGYLFADNFASFGSLGRLPRLVEKLAEFDRVRLENFRHPCRCGCARNYALTRKACLNFRHFHYLAHVFA